MINNNMSHQTLLFIDVYSANCNYPFILELTADIKKQNSPISFVVIL